MSAEPHILCAGRLYCDLIFTGLPQMPGLGTETYAQGFSAHAGGGAFITAAHLAELGAQVSLAAMVPAAPFNQIIQSELESAGVDLSLCQSLGADMDPQVTVALGSAGDRAFVTRRSGPPCPMPAVADVTARGIRHLHVGELATLIECPALATLARDAGLTLSADCSWDDTLATPKIVEALSKVDLFLPNEAECTHLRSLGVPFPFAPLCVVKKGGEGSTAHTRDHSLHMPTQPQVPVDTTGAGDAFNAGFIWAWLSGTDLENCLRAGNAKGGGAILHSGGFLPASDRPERSARVKIVASGH